MEQSELVFLSGLLGVAQCDTPKWPDKYTVCGTLQLPYAEIKEPFCAYYDKKSNKSRIDYYPGWFEHDGRGCVCIWLGGRRVALL